MSETWSINAGGRVYGPYTTEQMRAFHAEGRLAPHSLIGRTGQDQFHAAGEDPVLSPLFSGSAVETPRETVSNTPPPARQPAAQPEPRRFGQEQESSTSERSRFVIVADMRSGSISALEEEIFNLGQAYRFMPQAWVLTSEASLNIIRQALMQKLGKLDVIFVVDTVHDRAAWFNFGPEADSRVRRMWARTPEGTRKAG